MLLEKIKIDLAKAINKKLKKNLIKAEDFVYPPKGVNADLALPIFGLAKDLKKNPDKIALELALEAPLEQKWIERMEAKGAYVNFYLKRDAVTKEVLKGIKPINKGKSEKVMIEYISPNSNKPLHLGHIRNAFLGTVLANILEYCGYKVTRSAIVNDRGVAICKVMLAYQKWGKGDTPEKSGLKSDHFVGKYYVMFDTRLRKAESRQAKKLEKEVQEMLRKWEDGERETVALWKKIQKWVLDGYKETYKRLGADFDKTYYESALYKDGAKLVQEYFKTKKFSKDQKGNIIARLEKCKLPDKVMLRGDGTAIYSTTDIALAKKRAEEGYKKVYYIVGSEQDLYFKQLFCILRQTGLMKDGLKHLSYGLVELPEGRMKSREGTVVDADDLLNKMEGLIAKEVKARHDFIKQQEADRRAQIIALAALKFYILNVNPPNKIKFNPKESINFTGKTGPYLLYTYARLISIVEKSGKVLSKPDFSKLKDKDWALVLRMAKFSEAVISALNGMNPEEITSYLYDLSQRVSDFYHSERVLDAKPQEKALRLVIIKGVLKVMGEGLGLLGITPLKQM